VQLLFSIFNALIFCVLLIEVALGMLQYDWFGIGNGIRPSKRLEFKFPTSSSRKFPWRLESNGCNLFCAELGKVTSCVLVCV